jgi:hypothetical protein
MQLFAKPGSGQPWRKLKKAVSSAGIWHRNFFTHNYEVRGLTGLVDLYVMTGNHTYLDAALGGWAMLRESWLHVGGSLAINEVCSLKPKQRLLLAAQRSRFFFCTRENMERRFAKINSRLPVSA